MRFQGTASAALAGLLLATAPGALAQDQQSEAQGRYQIVEATPDRVWRLDTVTGEISLCKLQGDRLICTHSSKAAEPPQKDYESLQEEQQAEQQAEAERQLRFLDRMLEMFRELIRYALERQEGEPA